MNKLFIFRPIRIIYKYCTLPTFWFVSVRVCELHRCMNKIAGLLFAHFTMFTVSAPYYGIKTKNKIQLYLE